MALPETPADLDPAAGILTQGEGNVLSHVQLLARALGIPNVVLGPSAYDRIAPHDGKQVFFIATPGGRVILKEAVGHDGRGPRGLRRVHAQPDAHRPTAASEAAAEAAHRPRQDRSRAKTLPIDLTEVRRKDSGRFCGPKAAYLGELKHLFPDHVARGIVVPFGAYYDHYQHATVAVPDDAARPRASRPPGEPLPAFVERTYKTFFDELIPAKKSERELSAWIDAAPRRHPPLDPAGAAVAGARARRSATGSTANGLLDRPDKRTPSAASCAATPTSRTSTTSTAPASTSRSSTASRSTTSTTG